MGTDSGEEAAFFGCQNKCRNSYLRSVVCRGVDNEGV